MKIFFTSVGLAFAVSVLFMSFDANAQAFDKGTNVINLGIGLGGQYTYFGSGYSESPALSISYEKGIWPNIGPGTISLGGLLAYKGFSYNYTAYDHSLNLYTYNQSWNYYILGIRGAYHLKVAGNDKFDPYAGIMIARYSLNYSETSNDPNYGRTGYYVNNVSYNSYITPSLFVGARYAFSTNFGAFAELEYGYSNLTLGLSYKW